MLRRKTPFQITRSSSVRRKFRTSACRRSMSSTRKMPHNLSSAKKSPGVAGGADAAAAGAAAARGLVLCATEPPCAAPGGGGKGDARRADPDRPRRGRGAFRVARSVSTPRHAAQRGQFRRAGDRRPPITAGGSTRGGRCTLIPSLVPGQSFTPGHIHTRPYPACEVQGNIWVFFGEDPVVAPDIPVLDGFDGRAPDLVESVRFAAAIDHAVIGLMDPAHGPFVHSAWWWRSRRSIQQKAKAFAPSPFGFAMTPHAPSRNSRAYRLLGGTPETEIVFRLPSIRIEQICAGRHRVTNLTAITPIDDRVTEINHCIYWTLPWLGHLEARIAALCAGLSAPGPRHHGASAARAPLQPAAHLDRRRRYPGKMVLPPKARIPPGPCRRPSVREPGPAAYPRDTDAVFGDRVGCCESGIGAGGKMTIFGSPTRLKGSSCWPSCV